MNPQECVEILTDQSRRIEEKSAAIADYLQWQSMAAGLMRLPARLGRAAALRYLFDALPKDDPAAHVALKAALEQLKVHAEQRDLARQAETRDLAAQLRSISPGSAIIVREGNRAFVAAFGGLQRTRFIYEFADGLRFSAPVKAFGGIAEGEVVECLPEEMRQRRELVRALAGRGCTQASAQILSHATDLLVPLLDELVAALQRLFGAPGGLSTGAYRDMPGSIRRIRAEDEALVQRIPPMVAELVGSLGLDQVREQVARLRDTRAAELVNKALAKIVNTNQDQAGSAGLERTRE